MRAVTTPGGHGRIHTPLIAPKTRERGLQRPTAQAPRQEALPRTHRRSPASNARRTRRAPAPSSPREPSAAAGPRPRRGCPAWASPRAERNSASVPRRAGDVSDERQPPRGKRAGLVFSAARDRPRARAEAGFSDNKARDRLGEIAGAVLTHSAGKCQGPSGRAGLGEGGVLRTPDGIGQLRATLLRRGRALREAHREIGRRGHRGRDSREAWLVIGQKRPRGREAVSQLLSLESEKK